MQNTTRMGWVEILTAIIHLSTAQTGLYSTRFPKLMNQIERNSAKILQQSTAARRRDFRSQNTTWKPRRLKQVAVIPSNC
ncbi:hypothetical protein A4A49_08997 [Nicotiana attenuata]|uniref:Secreted protein n=1 Tax=Nicotiana attenuata TaxID=49451 RepID=A0A1J6IJF5_NICAT|nr:hypothetical protein A4A49_08997 [Nicotiana attenuata]